MKCKKFFFLLGGRRPRGGRGQDASGIAKALLGEGVIVRDMSVWGLKEFIRVTIGTEAENKRFLNALTRIRKVL